MHDGMIRECVQAFLETTDLAANGYDNLCNAVLEAD